MLDALIRLTPKELRGFLLQSIICPRIKSKQGKVNPELYNLFMKTLGALHDEITYLYPIEDDLRTHIGQCSPHVLEYAGLRNNLNRP